MTIADATLERSDHADDTSIDDILREIARGGLAGLLVGIILGGIGGRLVMRLAALLVPGSVGRPTENGNIVGDITLNGSIALVVFVGLFAGVAAGSIWVTIRPWLPERAALRALASVPIALALGTRSLIEDHNPDFIILGHDPVVVASLVVLIAAFGPAMVLAEGILERRLPRIGERPGVGTAYTAIAMLGTLLTVFVILPSFLGTPLRIAGLALLVVGGATLASWVLRARHQAIPRALPWIGRAALVAATVGGLVVALPEITGAMGMPWR